MPTIRYYEEIGLIPPALRSRSCHRVYRSGAVRQLGFIRRCRDFGFSIEQVKDFLALAAGNRDCAQAREIAEARLRDVRGKMVELMALERSLARFVSVCGATCAGGPAPDCNILRDLGIGGPDERSACC